MTTFRLPDLGEGLQDAEIVAWHVAVGDHVVTDQPLLSVETEKAVVEIPAPQTGTIAALHGRPGDVVPVGAPLVEFADDATVDGGAIVGDLRSPERPRHLQVVPAARALAQRLDVDLAAVSGSGPGGAITVADVKAARRLQPPGQPLRGVRRAMAASMARAGASVVAATLTDSADIHTWWSPAADVTVRLIRAIGAGCLAVPALNDSYDGEGGMRRHNRVVNLGLAVDTEDGLFVPVLRDACAHVMATMRAEVSRLTAAVRDRTIGPAELRGPTITLSNFGMLGGRYAALVVVPPQVAILGAGRVDAEARLVGGRLVPRRCLPLSLTFDHRAVTGGEAARWLAAVVADLQSRD